MALQKEDEKKIIVRGMQMYFTCKMCEELQWNKKCTNKADCGERLYKLLEWHFKKEDK